MSERVVVPSGRPAPILLLLVAAAILAAVAAWFVLGARDVAAGVTIAVALGPLVVAGRMSRRRGSPRLMFADSAVERIVHAALLAAVTWSRLPEQPRVALAALAALVGSYLASYLRAKSTGLGFDLEESTIDRSVLLGAPALGLVSGFVETGLWAAVGWSSVVAARRALEVGSQGEPG